MGKDEPDISELVEKAKIVAEATGRDEQEVLADLLDDGIVNLSNEEAKGKDLVTQLKEAAELITTVQAINKDVSENKAPMRQIKIIPFKEKNEWELCPKYNIGNKV